MSDSIVAHPLYVSPSEARKTPVVTDPKPSVKDDGRSASLAPLQTHSTLLFFSPVRKKRYLYLTFDMQGLQGTVTDHISAEFSTHQPFVYRSIGLG
jgi:hypothetical protein